MTMLVRCCHDAFQRILDQRFGFAVQAAGGFIQHQNARVLQDDSRQCDALFFAAAQAVAAFADDGVVAVGQVHDEVVDVGSAAGGFDLGLRGVQLGILQVGADGIVEQVGLLRHHADLRGKRVEGHIAQVMPVDADDARWWDHTGAG